MAKFTSDLSFATDFRTTNLYWFHAYGYASDVLKGANFVYNGTVYKDVAYADGSAGYGSLELDLGGYGFTTDFLGKPNGGTVTGILQLNLDTHRAQWTAEGISLSFPALYNSGLTPSNGDELKLLGEALRGNDTIKLSNFVDYFRGFSGNDSLYGYNGDDTLMGDAGADKLYGGDGKDKLYGGTGADAFIFDTGPSKANIDRLPDFSHAENDKLYISKAAFLGLTHFGALAVGEFYAASGATKAHDASDRFIYNTATGKLYYDDDGIGGHASLQIAVLGSTGHPALNYTDFQIIA